jgi:hypothetical protein
VVYSFAGWMVHRDLLWVFTKIPYSTLQGAYGSGRWFHFLDKMTYAFGVPIYVLMGLGIIGTLVKATQRRSKLEMSVLVLGGMAAFVVAHSLFWALGLFNSMGLMRVLVGIAPLAALVAAVGFETLGTLIQSSPKLQKIVQALVLTYVLIFPFTTNPAAIQWDRALHLLPEQVLAEQVSAELEDDTSAPRRYCYSAPYLSIVLDVDHFDPAQRVRLDADFLTHLSPGDLVIWDSWFVPVEHHISQEQLDANNQLEHLFERSCDDHGRNIKFAVYRVK